MVHGRCDVADVGETIHPEVDALSHQRDDSGEPAELFRLRRSQWVFFEERDDALLEVIERTHLVTVHRLPVVVRPSIDRDVAASEEVLQVMQHSGAPFCLDDRKTRLDLPTEPTRSVPEDRNAEAAFAVDEADDPLRETRPFLLIVRTGRIFTAHVDTLRRGCGNEGSTAGYSEFPAYSQLHCSELLPTGATPGARQAITLGPL